MVEKRRKNGGEMVGKWYVTTGGRHWVMSLKKTSLHFRREFEGILMIDTFSQISLSNSKFSNILLGVCSSVGCVL